MDVQLPCRLEKNVGVTAFIALPLHQQQQRYNLLVPNKFYNLRNCITPLCLKLNYVSFGQWLQSEAAEEEKDENSLKNYSTKKWVELPVVASKQVPI